MNKPTTELLEQFITALKNDGCSKTASIVRVATHFKIGLGAAKCFVHESKAWSDLKAAHEAFQTRLLNTEDSADDLRRQDEQ
jgi:hypothetical protein